MSTVSFGEAEVRLNSSSVGKVRVLGIYPASGLYPRLGATLGLTLHDREKGSLSPSTDSLVGYSLAALTGELRLAEDSDALGAVTWIGSQRRVQSSKTAYEQQVQVAVDLDHWRLEQIERRRGSEAPAFWLALWPVVSEATKLIALDVQPFRMAPTREAWLDWHSKVGGGSYEILEVLYAAKEVAFFQRPVQRLKEARAAFREGDYDKTVGLCRTVLEATRQELNLAKPDDFKAALLAATGEKKGPEYATIVSKLMQLASLPHHEVGAPLTYSRLEAQSILRITEALLALLGGLSLAPPPPVAT